LTLRNTTDNEPRNDNFKRLRRSYNTNSTYSRLKRDRELLKYEENRKAKRLRLESSLL